MLMRVDETRYDETVLGVDNIESERAPFEHVNIDGANSYDLVSRNQQIRSANRPRVVDLTCADEGEHVQAAVVMDSARTGSCSIWAGEAGSAPCSRSHSRTAVTASHDVTTSSPGTMLHKAALVASTSSSITFTEACGFCSRMVLARMSATSPG